MPTTMSKMLRLGMTFHGTLRPGSPADVALLPIWQGEFRLVDSQRNAITAKPSSMAA